MFEKMITSGTYHFYRMLGYEVVMEEMTGDMDYLDIPYQVLARDATFLSSTVHIEIPDGSVECGMYLQNKGCGGVCFHHDRSEWAALCGGTACHPGDHELCSCGREDGTGKCDIQKGRAGVSGEDLRKGEYNASHGGLGSLTNRYSYATIL